MTKARAAVEERLARLPNRPGVYLFKDEAGTVLYVGKANSLRARVRSYFRGQKSHSLKTRELVRHIADLETIVVGSEVEALILEANLIKEHQARFNIQLRDDKQYPYIKVTVREPFPRVYVTRRVTNDGNRYFGPYTSVGTMRQALEVIKRLYTVRSCRYALPTEHPERPCLDYHIGRCLAPCVGLQSEDSYRGMVAEILDILEGETEAIRGAVERQMQEASGGLDFERAARLRDAIAGLDGLAREQRVQRVRGDDLDVFGLARDGGRAAAVVMRIRRGVLLGIETLRFEDVGEETDADLLGSVASRYYVGRGAEGRTDLPREVVLPTSFADLGALEEILSGSAHWRVSTLVPQRGEKRRLADLANENARHALEDVTTGLDPTRDRAEDVLYDVQEKLDLKIVPRLMVCFDISHTQGSENVGSAVVFENGEPKKAEYRRMKIVGGWGNDDFRSMNEVVTRYLRRRKEEEKPIPDLLVIDGGKGQLGAAVEALRELELADPAVVAIAKKEELLFTPGRSEPIRLSRRDRTLHLFQRMRNEAHRFAVVYNRKLRRKRTLSSGLGEVPGVGPQRQRALLKRFGSLSGVKRASVDEIARVSGISDALAIRILTYLGS